MFGWLFCGRGLTRTTRHEQKYVCGPYLYEPIRFTSLRTCPFIKFLFAVFYLIVFLLGLFLVLQL